MDQQQLLEKTTSLASRARTHLPSSTEGFVKIPPEDLTKLKESCSDAWNDLEKVQTELVNIRKTQRAGPENGANLTIQKAKEKILEGTTQAYKDSQPIVLPDSVAIQQQLLLTDLEKTVGELNDVLAYIKTQRQEAKDELEREQELVSQREQIKDALAHRLESLHSEKRQQPDKNLVAEAEQKQERAEKYHRKVMKQLGRFIEEHFPPPAAEDVNTWARKRKVPSTRGDVLPLQAVLQELMNKCLDADDPYVQTDGRYWPPYLHLLVRCGVAQRDPNDDSRFKMTPFHL